MFTPKQRADQLVQQGIRLHEAGRFNEATAVYRQALAVEPRNSDALNLLGVILRQQDRCAEAVPLIKKAISIQPRIPDYHFNLAEALRALKQYDDSILAYNNAIRGNGRDPEFHHGLGMALEAAGRPDEAIPRYRQCIQVQPNFVLAYAELTILLLKQGQPEEALQMAQKAMALQPDIPESQFAMGAVLERQRRYEPAEACYRRVLELKPDHAFAHNQLGIVLKDTGRYGPAIEIFHAGLQHHPDDADLHGNLANTLVDCGRVHEAITEYRCALRCNPNHVVGHSNLLLALNYAADLAPGQILAEHKEWARLHATGPAKSTRPLSPDRTPGRRLRIGYVSPDFREHSVAHFVQPLFAAHDHARVEVFAYADLSRPDRVTENIQRCCDQWRSITGVQDEQAADMIRRDRIDILIDLAGHTGNNRLLLLAHRPAPIQATYVGYCATTGMPSVDYRFTDANADPPGMTDAFYTEKLIRLPGCFLCYLPANDAPPVAPSPAAANSGCVTFGSFNNLAKVAPPVIEAWAQVLRAVPNARMVVKCKGLHDPGVQEDVRQRFAAHGISADRLELYGATMPFLQHLNLYNRVDIALDTFPYNGTTTTCESMWMGVPVIALAGNTHASRVGVSLLSSVGLADLTASTRDAYVQLAVALANDIPRLQSLRATFRDRMTSSPLMDAKRLARGIEDAYAQMWQQL
jgi:predicted O-linked N-acetylglucosamine transferase (SPINDLY family)